MRKLILIIEDEQDLVDTLSYSLQQSGFETRAALSGAEAFEQLQRKPLPNLVLLDLMLPDTSGMDICRQMKADPKMRQIPVLMLTAKSDETDRIGGFEAGADDYVVKPFSVRELQLRIEAILRRGTESVDRGRRIECGILTVDLDTHEVLVDGQPVILSSLEFRLLAFFLKNQGHVLSRDQLLEKVWGIASNVQTRTVDVHIMRLREKLGEAGEYVATVRGFGYRFLNEPNGVASCSWG